MSRKRKRSTVEVMHNGISELTPVSDELALIVLKLIKEEDSGLISFIEDFLNR